MTPTFAQINLARPIKENYEVDIVKVQLTRSDAGYYHWCKVTAYTNAQYPIYIAVKRGDQAPFKRTSILVSSYGYNGIVEWLTRYHGPITIVGDEPKLPEATLVTEDIL
jgi:hypothetical protein